MMCLKPWPLGAAAAEGEYKRDGGPYLHAEESSCRGGAELSLGLACCHDVSLGLVDPHSPRGTNSNGVRHKRVSREWSRVGERRGDCASHTPLGRRPDRLRGRRVFFRRGRVREKTLLAASRRGLLRFGLTHGLERVDVQTAAICRKPRGVRRSSRCWRPGPRRGAWTASRCPKAQSAGSLGQKCLRV